MKQPYQMARLSTTWWQIGGENNLIYYAALWLPLRCKLSKIRLSMPGLFPFLEWLEVTFTEGCVKPVKKRKKKNPFLLLVCGQKRQKLAWNGMLSEVSNSFQRHLVCLCHKRVHVLNMLWLDWYGCNVCYVKACFGNPSWTPHLTQRPANDIN